MSVGELAGRDFSLDVTEAYFLYVVEPRVIWEREVRN